MGCANTRSTGGTRRSRLHVSGGSFPKATSSWGSSSSSQRHEDGQFRVPPVLGEAP